MKLAVVTCTPEVTAPVPVALLSGSFDERLEKARKLGYDGIELMALHPGDLNAEDLRAGLARHGLEVAAVGSGAIALIERLTLLAADRETSALAEARLAELIAFATRIGAPLVTIGGFRGRLSNPTWVDPPGARAHLIELLHRAADRAAAAGVRLVLEPLNRYESDIVNNAAEGLALLAEVGHDHLGLLLDTFHMNIEEPDYAESIAAVMAVGRLWHVHLGDSNRWPSGYGHIDFAEILLALRRTGYDGYLSAELLPRPDPDEAAAATIRYIGELTLPSISWRQM